jgi:WD40 repeat protein
MPTSFSLNFLFSHCSSCVRFSPNGRFILASSLDGRLRLWDYLLGKPLKTYSGHENQSVCCAATFLPPVGSQASIASGGEDGCVTVWDVSKKEKLSQWQAHEEGASVLGIDAHHSSEVHSVVTCAGGSTNASGPGSGDFGIKVWTMAEH